MEQVLVNYIEAHPEELLGMKSRKVRSYTMNLAKTISEEFKNDSKEEDLKFTKSWLAGFRRRNFFA